MSAAATGDLVSVNWSCTTAEGQVLPEEAQVFDQGRVRLVLGAGGAIPVFHRHRAISVLMKWNAADLVECRLPAVPSRQGPGNARGRIRLDSC